jgi:transposase
LEPGCTGFE